MTLGERLSAWMQATGFTEKSLAEKMGLTAPAIYHWLDDRCSPSQRHLERAVTAMGLTMKRFYGGVPGKKARA